MAKAPKKPLIRVEKYADYKVLIYEDQPTRLTRAGADALFEQYPEVKEIHELHPVWGGRWTRNTRRATPDHTPPTNVAPPKHSYYSEHAERQHRIQRDLK